MSDTKPEITNKKVFTGSVPNTFSLAINFPQLYGYILLITNAEISRIKQVISNNGYPQQITENIIKNKNIIMQKKKPTASGVPRRSPIQVLTRPNVA